MRNWKMIACLVPISCIAFYSAPAQNTARIFRDAGKQLSVLYHEVKTNSKGGKIFPRALENDSVKLVASGDWTSGFWPGILWFMYEFTQDGTWKSKAEEFTLLMDRETANRNSHDIGFKVYNSYGNAYRLTGKEEFKQKLIDGAHTLATRFNPATGCIRSWDFGNWQYPVIIDNMMNLELLFAATRSSGDSGFYRLAVTHANTTLRNHFRDDFSSWHVVNYDTVTGAVISKTTHQGFSDQSAWARGQAWGLYGYTMCYRETGDPAYLRLAEKIADFLLNHPALPADKIPYWDFQVAGLPGEPRDASAAAIIASALFELRQYSTKGKQYEKFANKVLNNLTKSYRAAIGTHRGFVLQHSTGNKPFKGEVDVPIIYADYYFLEALLRQRKENSGGKLPG